MRSDTPFVVFGLRTERTRRASLCQDNPGKDEVEKDPRIADLPSLRRFISPGYFGDMGDPDCSQRGREIPRYINLSPMRHHRVKLITSHAQTLGAP